MTDKGSSQEWDEAKIGLIPLEPSYKRALLGAVAAVRSNVPNLQLRFNPDSDKHLPEPCPWADEMMDHYNWIKLKQPLSRDRFRELFMIFHLALKDEEFCRNLPVKKLLSNLIIGSRNPFHEDEELFCVFREGIPEDKQVVWEMPEIDMAAVAKRIKELSKQDELIRGPAYGYSGMSEPMNGNDSLFHDWYMADSNFCDAQTYFCLDALLLLMAHVIGPRETYRHLQAYLAKNFETGLSIRSSENTSSPPKLVPCVSKEAVYRMCANIAADKAPELVRQVLMAFDLEKYPNRKSSPRQLEFAEFFIESAKFGPRVSLLQHLMSARYDQTELVNLISKDPKLAKSYRRCFYAAEMIKFYKKNEPFEKDGQQFHFKYWAFAKLFESACFKEIAKKNNVEFLAFCVHLDRGGEREKMHALKSNRDIAKPYIEKAEEIWRIKDEKSNERFRLYLAQTRNQ